MWIVMYNGITGECFCEPYTDTIANVLAWMTVDTTVCNDAWFII